MTTGRTAWQTTVEAPAQPVRRFGELTREDVDYGGGKGANLGELTSAGFPVPPGFVVGASAYAAFRDASGLRERLAEGLTSLDVDDREALVVWAVDELRRRMARALA